MIGRHPEDWKQLLGCSPTEVGVTSSGLLNRSGKKSSAGKGAAAVSPTPMTEVRCLNQAAIRQAADLANTASCTVRSEAQEAAAAKLRTVFALRNLIGP